MKNILVVIFSVSALNVSSQNHLIGIKGGFNWANVITSNFPNQPENRIGITGGLTYEYLTKGHFSIGADLIYNQRGFMNEIIFTDNFGNPTGEKYQTRYNYDYISLPIKSGFSIGKAFYGFANIAIVPSLLINAQTISPTFNTDGQMIGNVTSDMTSRVTKFDLAGCGEVGLGCKLKNRYWFFTSFAYQSSFTTFTNSRHFPDSIIRHKGMQVTIGLKYGLVKD